VVTDVLFPTIAQDYPDAGGTLTAWLVADGDTVHAGQEIAEVTVSKAVGTIEAPAGGVIRLLVAVEDSVVQGAPIARIED
jgi:pyruvate/2-oxoglutarate dehydrogenase complex dihydrolipoamide acyltransferase (E2) component